MDSELVSTEVWADSLDFCRSSIQKFPGCELLTRLKRIEREMSMRHNRVALDIAQKLERGDELDQNDRTYVESPPRGTPKAFAKRYKTNPTSANKVIEPSQKAFLEKQKEKSPFFLFRVVTRISKKQTKGSRKTNGHTTKTCFYPARSFAEDKVRNLTAESERLTPMGKNIYDIDYATNQAMFACHFIWDDRILDEYLSWTMSPLFAFVHLYLRHQKDQEDGFVIFADRREMRKVTENTPEKQAEDQPADFYCAPDLCDAFDVLSYQFTDDNETRQKGLACEIHYRKLNHEYVTQGEVILPEKSRFQFVSFPALRDWVFSLIPEPKINIGCKASTLYNVLRHLRCTLYEKVRACTEDELNTAEKMARSFTQLEPGEEGETIRPNFWLFLHLLSFRRRETGDEVFKNRIRQLGYTRADLDDGLHEEIEVMPANLPEKVAFMNLLRDAQTVLGGEPIKDNVVRPEYYTTSEKARAIMGRRGDEYFERNKIPPLLDSIRDYIETGRCSLGCCSLWTKKQGTKRKRTSEDDGNDDDDTSIYDNHRRTGIGKTEPPGWTDGMAEVDEEDAEVSEAPLVEEAQETTDTDQTHLLDSTTVETLEVLVIE